MSSASKNTQNTQTMITQVNLKVKTEVVRASKELVDALLACNTANRNPRARWIKAYVEDIKAGRWYVTNQGVGVDWDGVLVDGQNRLMAIRDAGYPPVQFLLTTGLNPEVRKVVDQHAKRSIRDALYFAFNARVASSAPAIARVLIKFADGPSDKHVNHTSQQVFDAITQYQSEIEAITNTPQDGKFFAAPYLAGFVYCLAETNNQAKIIEFMKLVEDGVNLSATSPAYHLRNFVFLSKSSCKGASLQIERFFKTKKATMAYVESKEMKVLRV